jgi:hypothetical protein
MTRLITAFLPCLKINITPFSTTQQDRNLFTFARAGWTDSAIHHAVQSILTGFLKRLPHLREWSISQED